mgnify:CR=1 FL=1
MEQQKCQFLIRCAEGHRPEPELPHSFLWPGLLMAVQAGAELVVQDLLPRTQWTQEQQVEMCQLAARGGHWRILEKMIYEYYIRPASEILLEASKDPFLSTTRFASLTRGLDLDVCEVENGMTPLLLCAKHGFLSRVEWCLEHGANPRTTSRSHQTLLGFAITNNWQELVERRLSLLVPELFYGECHSGRDTGAHIAARLGHWSLLSWLLNCTPAGAGAAAAAVNVCGFNILMTGARKPQFYASGCLAKLILMGSQPSLASHRNNTAPMMAFAHECYANALMLLGDRKSTRLNSSHSSVSRMPSSA